MPSASIAADHHAGAVDQVLVTGGGGFIGSHVVAGLLDAGCRVRVLERAARCVEHLPRQVDVVIGDVSDPAVVSRAVRGCDRVMHLAANPNLYARDPMEFERVNHRGTLHVLAACRDAGVRKLVHVSTESIHASPDRQATVREDTALPASAMFGPYLLSKWRAEQAAARAAASGQPVVIACPSVPIGPGDRHQGPLTRVMRQFIEGKVRAYLPGTINVIDVRDLARGLVSALNVGEPGRRYLICGHTLTYRQWFEALSRTTGVAAPTWRVPYPLALGFAFAEEWWCRNITGGTPMATVTGVRLTRRSFRFDAARSRAALQWPLRPLDPSLRDAVAWMVEQGQVSLGASPLADSASPDS